MAPAARGLAATVDDLAEAGRAAGRIVAWRRQDGVLVDDLYSGTAGVLLGCAEAAAAGLGTARVSAGARARLLHLARHGPGVVMMPDDGLFCGSAGVAVALRAWSRMAGDAAAASAAAQVTLRIAGRILQASAGRPQCTDVISGDAGWLRSLCAPTPNRARPRPPPATAFPHAP
jgi:hypothetical protein